jgi:hypothetical protein
MPFIGDPFSRDSRSLRIRYIGIVRGLAQRNKGRKTSYVDTSMRGEVSV